MPSNHTRLRASLSWRLLLTRASLAACLAAMSAFTLAACGGAGNSGGEAPPPAAAPAAAPSLAQGGEGKTRVLLVSGGHGFERDLFFEMFDSFGADITYTHVEQPAAYALFDPARAAKYDVFVMYEWAVGPASAELKKNLPALLRQGKGVVFLHHALASFGRNWPEYAEVMGSTCDNQPSVARGVKQPIGGFFNDTAQRITVVDKEHPVTKGLGDGYDIVDEVYVCPFYEDAVHPLLRTNFELKEHDKYLNPKTPYTNMVGWVKTAENSPIVALQGGHGPASWANPAFRTALRNAILWAASPEALTWAKANPKQIFK
jgi:type 1 glutamine amidotransferase